MLSEMCHFLTWFVLKLLMFRINILSVKSLHCANRIYVDPSCCLKILHTAALEWRWGQVWQTYGNHTDETINNSAENIFRKINFF